MELKLLDEFNRIVGELVLEYGDRGLIFYHGSTDKNFLGKNGIHVGTKLAAKEALEARIGIPAQGEWDGSREYGKTLLAGRDTIKRRGIFGTGYNSSSRVPEEDYLPTQRVDRATYSDGTFIPFDCSPIIFPVQIIGRMTNSPNRPHSDNIANSMMTRNLRMGNAKSGYYYINIGEDEGSISAVVPDGTFLRIL